jgi:predicted aspartyl protease
VAVRVVRVKTAALVVAGICVDGKGPFTFLVDTGSAVSLIDVGLASRLGVRTVGKVTGSSFGCRRSLSTAYLDRWTLGGRSLKGQWVAVGEITSHAFPNLRGLLGADVLSRFGEVRLDYAAQTLTMGSEGALPTFDVRPGSAAPSTPGSLSRGTHQVVPMGVQVSSGLSLGLSDLSAVIPEVEVSVAGQRYPFVVDTGAARTVLSPEVVRNARLGPPTGEGLFTAGLGCSITGSNYNVTAWSLGGLRLGPASIASNQLPPGVGGLLGSGTLEQYSPVVFDFTDGAILLGPLRPS